MITLVSESFQDMGKLEAEHLGVPDLPFVVVPHPFGTIPPGRARQLAGQAAERVLDLLRAREPVRVERALRRKE